MTEYAVLHLPKPAPIRTRGTKSMRLGPEDAGAQALRVTRQDLDEKQAAEAKASPDVAIAKRMKTSLVRPLSSAANTQGDSWAIAAIGADASPRDGSGCVVAVLDTGIDAAHPAFGGMSLDERDFSGSGNGDREGHGTHCAGTIFGRDVNGQRIGVARGVARALIGKVLDDTGAGNTVSIYEGLVWAFQNQAQVISLSVGIDFPGQVEEKVQAGWPIELATSEALVEFTDNLRLFELFRQSARTPMLGFEPLIIAAAGNESRRQEDTDFVVAPSLPASVMHLSVGAVGRDGANYRVADFSNAPPQLVAPGVDIVSAAIGGGLVSNSGTSMACPHVAGLAALWADQLRSERMSVNATTLLSALIRSTRRDVLVDFDGAMIRNYGEGLVTAPKP